MCIQNKVKEFQWRSINNILYTESIFENRKYQMENDIFVMMTETIQHSFFNCSTSKLVLNKLQDILFQSNIIGILK